MHAWEQWGEDCVKRFRGMFAFALWDRNRQTLFLARDRLGVKPLYYALLDDGTLLFGSELKSLLAHGGLRRDIDPLAVEEYFALGYVAEPRTHLPPGAASCRRRTRWCIRRGQPVAEPKEYWDVHFTLGNPISAEDACAELVRAAARIGALRLISEVPLGAFLSGGVDSSAVVAMMAGLSDEPVQHLLDRLRRPAVQRERVRADGGRRATAPTTASRPCSSDDFDLIDTLARLYDEPYADSSAIPTYRVCQLARKHVTVALSGDGGDETFGGYRRYRLHLMEERMRCGAAGRHPPAAVRAARARLPQGRLGAARVPRQDHLRRHGAHVGGGLLPFGVDPARADARAAVQRPASSATWPATTRRRCSTATPAAPAPTTRWR